MDYSEPISDQGKSTSRDILPNDEDSLILIEGSQVPGPNHCPNCQSKSYSFVILTLIFLAIFILALVFILQSANLKSSKEWIGQFSKANQEIRQELEQQINSALMKSVRQIGTSDLQQVKNILEEQREELNQLKELTSLNNGEMFTASVDFIQTEIQQSLQIQRKQIALEQQVNKNQLVMIDRKISETFNITTTQDDFQEAIKPLYTTGQLKQKQQYESKVLAYLQRWNKQFDWLLEKFKYHFRFIDDPKDLEPHFHVNYNSDTDIDEKNCQICGVMPSYMDVSIYAIEHSLNSIFRQNYSNYVAVIFSHPSKVANGFIKNYLAFHNISKNNYKYVQTMKNKTALQNIYNAIYNYCPYDSIAFVLEGGSALQGREIFRTINSMHKSGLYGFTMSNYYKINPITNYADWGWTRMPSRIEIENRDPRIYPYFQFYTFRTQVFKQIKLSDFKDDFGKFFDRYTYALMIPLLQLSCSFTTRFMGSHMFQYTPQNYKALFQRQKDVYNKIRRRKNYNCSTYLMNKNKNVKSNGLIESISQQRVQKKGVIDTPLHNKTFNQFTNKQGQTIVDKLYQTEGQKEQRAFFEKRRREATIKWEKRYNGLSLINYNIKTEQSSTESDEKEERAEHQEYERLNKHYQLEKYNLQELPMCVIVYPYSLDSIFRIQYNLNSIFRQNYTNYFAVIINNALRADIDTAYKKYLNFYNIPKEKYIYVPNSAPKTVLENIYNAVHNYCSADSMALTLDVGDEFVGKNVLRLFNAQFQKLKAGFIYTNSYSLVGEKAFELIQSSDYSQQQKKQVKFKDIPLKILWTKSFNSTLFRQIDKSTFLTAKGLFFQFGSNFALSIPIMQKSCGKVYFVPEASTLNVKESKEKSIKFINYLQEIAEAELHKKEMLSCDQYYQSLPFAYK